MQEAPRNELSTSPAFLLRASHDLLRFWHPTTAGVWPRAAALLARQALESALDDFWALEAPGVDKASTRAQLLCLRDYADEQTAERAAHAWYALTRACHHHAYDLPPTGAELTNWIDDVAAVTEALRGTRPVSTPLPAS